MFYHHVNTENVSRFVQFSSSLQLILQPSCRTTVDSKLLLSETSLKVVLDCYSWCVLFEGAVLCCICLQSASVTTRC